MIITTKKQDILLGPMTKAFKTKKQSHNKKRNKTFVNTTIVNQLRTVLMC